MFFMVGSLVRVSGFSVTLRNVICAVSSEVVDLFSF